MTDYDYETIEYYHDQARDFAAEVHHCHNRINILELQLNEKRREAASARLRVQALKNDIAELKRAWRADVANLREPTVPEGDLKKGYFCECGTEIDYAFEQRFCSWCGAQFEWTATPQTDNEWASGYLDKLPERMPEQERFAQLAGALA